MTVKNGISCNISEDPNVVNPKEAFKGFFGVT